MKRAYSSSSSSSRSIHHAVLQASILMHCDSATKQIKTVLRILEGTRSRVWGRGAPLAPIRPARMCQDPACHWWLCFASLAVEVGCALPESLPSQLKGSRTLCQRRSPHSDRPHPRHTIRVTTTGPLACLALGKYRSPQVASVFAVLPGAQPSPRWVGGSLCSGKS